MSPPAGATPAADKGLRASQVVLDTLVVLAVAGAFWLAYRFAGALFTLFAAMVLGTAVRPGLDWLHRRGLSRRLGAVVLYVAILGVIVTAATLVVPVAFTQASAVAAKAPEYLGRARRALLESRSLAVRRLAHGIPAPERETTPGLAAAPGAGPRSVQETIRDLRLVGQSAFSLIAILLLGFYWTYEGEVTVRAALLLLALERREKVRELIVAAEEKVGGYVRGQLIVCSVTATLSLLAFLALGLPNALVIALVAGAMGAVPVVGGVLAAGVSLLAASADPRLIPWVLGAAFLIHLTQEYVVAPRVMGKSVGVHPFTILLAISGFGSLLGIAGAVLAIPMAAILQLLLDRFVFDTTNEYQPVPAQRGHLSVLSLEAKQLALDVRRQARDKADAPADEAASVKHMVESIANDLDRILTARQAKARPWSAT